MWSLQEQGCSAVLQVRILTLSGLLCCVFWIKYSDFVMFVIRGYKDHIDSLTYPLYGYGRKGKTDKPKFTTELLLNLFPMYVQQALGEPDF